MKLSARDCTPFTPQPTSEEREWLQELSGSLKTREHLVQLGGAYIPDEPVVYCDRDGTWWAGRYIGVISFKGGLLQIMPRFGLSTIQEWLLNLTNIALVDVPGQLREDEHFLFQLLAAVWSRAFVEAARHGLPALRREIRYEGSVLRGRLDVKGTIPLRASGKPHVVSLQRERSLKNAAARAIVAAYAVLRRWMAPLYGSEDHWLPSRARELLPHLIATTGPRPKVPTLSELNKVRYTPITISFRKVAELSRQIALQRGLVANNEQEGSEQGILLDVAEIWELYVIAALRQATLGFELTHATISSANETSLLRSSIDGAQMGRLKPDAVVSKGGKTIAVLDAKYKNLWPTKRAPNGPQREDLYQLTSYLSRYGADQSDVWGALIYPQYKSPMEAPLPLAELRSPWILDTNRHVLFLTLPHNLEQATQKLQTYFE